MTKCNICAALAMLLLVGCGKREKNYQVEPLSVTTETVTAGTTPGSLHYVGKVEAESSTPVSFTGVGTVTRIYVEEGQRVGKGQLIAEMDSTQAHNALEAAKAAVDQADDALRRMTVLHDAQSISEIDWMDVTTKARTAHASLEMATKALKDCRLTAPCSGIVGSKDMENGMTALPSQPVCAILDISSVKVLATVPEKEVGLFTPDLAAQGDVTITAEALPGRAFTTRQFVRSVEGDALTHTYDVRFTLPNPAGELLPGMVVTVTLPADTDAAEAASLITVPIRCIQQSPDGNRFVWLARDGKAVRQTVEVGEAHGDRIVVSKGLRGGEQLITEGYQKVSEGSAIK